MTCYAVYEYSHCSSSAYQALVSHQLKQSLLMFTFNLCKREPQEVLSESHCRNSCLDRNRVDLAEECVDKRKKIFLHLGALLDLSFKEEMAHTAGLSRHDVGEDRNDALASD